MGIRSHCMDINIICLKDYYRQLATFKLLLKMGIKVLLCMPCDTLTFKLFSKCDILKYALWKSTCYNATDLHSSQTFWWLFYGHFFSIRILINNFHFNKGHLLLLIRSLGENRREVCPLHCIQDHQNVKLFKKVLKLLCSKCLICVWT